MFVIIGTPSWLWAVCQVNILGHLFEMYIHTVSYQGIPRVHSWVLHHWSVGWWMWTLHQYPHWPTACMLKCITLKHHLSVYLSLSQKTQIGRDISDSKAASPSSQPAYLGLIWICSGAELSRMMITSDGFLSSMTLHNLKCRMGNPPSVFLTGRSWRANKCARGKSHSVGKAMPPFRLG